MSLLGRLFPFLARDIAGRVEELAREQARLGREQSRAITLLEGHGTTLEELAAAWEEQLEQRRRDATGPEQALGALEAEFTLRTVQELLPVADALQHTVDAARRLREGWSGTAGVPAEESLDRDLAAWMRGAVLVEQRLLAVLERLGALRIPTTGRRFDPHLHLAVAAVEEAEARDGVILSEELAGYTLGDRVLRHAEVIVARGRPPSPAPEDSEVLYFTG